MQHFVQSRSSAIKSLPWGAGLRRESLLYDWETIVDFGCGYGLQLADFAEAGRGAVEIDVGIDPNAYREADAHNYRLIEGDWADLKAESFDAGYSHHCLEHLRDPIGSLNLWARTIKPGGWMFISVPTQSDRAICGHLTQGYTTDQLVYLLSLGGFDCRQGRFRVEGNSIWGIARRPDDPTIIDVNSQGWGDVLLRLPAELQPKGSLLPNPKRIKW